MAEEAPTPIVAEDGGRELHMAVDGSTPAAMAQEARNVRYQMVVAGGICHPLP